MSYVSPAEMRFVEAEGYKVKPLICGFGPARSGGWVLEDPDGYSLTIGDHGGVSPTRWECYAEALGRIARE